MKDKRPAIDRAEIAANLREILATFDDRGHARAFNRAVLLNFRTGLCAIPRYHNGLWYPRRRRRP